jgi:hypothetical protein
MMMCGVAERLAVQPPQAPHWASFSKRFHRQKSTISARSGRLKRRVGRRLDAYFSPEDVKDIPSTSIIRDTYAI